LLTDSLDDILAHWTTPEPSSLAPRPRKTSFDALANHSALELGKDAHHLKTSSYRLARRLGGRPKLLTVEKLEAAAGLRCRSGRAVRRIHPNKNCVDEGGLTRPMTFNVLALYLRRQVNTKS
jgi:hypothetical protein